MMWNFFITLILNVVSLFYLLNIFINEISIKNVISFLMYLIVLVIFILFNYKDIKYNLGTVREQLKVNLASSFKKYLFSAFAYTIFYIVTFRLSISLIEKFIQKYFGADVFENAYISGLLLILIIVLCISRILYTLIKISPFIAICIFVVPLFIISVIGIENSLLDWTFLTLIILTTVLKFINFDIRYFLSDREIKNLNQEEDKIKQRLIKMKYIVLAYTPLLYLSLLISEKIYTSDSFIYLVNLLSSYHFEREYISYFSIFSLFSTFVKFIFILLSIMIYTEYKETIFRFISRFLLGVKEVDSSIVNGRYFQANYKFFQKKWSIDRNRYYYVHGKSIIKNDGKNKSDVYHITEDGIESKKGVRKNIVVSKDSLRVDSNYFILENSESFNSIMQETKYAGYRILNKVDHSIWILPIILLGLFIVVSIPIDNNMKTSYRGEYYALILNNDRTIKQVNENDKLSFQNQEIIVGNKRYRYDNVSITVRNMDDVNIGEINTSSKIIVMKDGDTKYYILKDSAIYNQYKK